MSLDNEKDYASVQIVSVWETNEFYNEAMIGFFLILRASSKLQHYTILGEAILPNNIFLPQAFYGRTL